MERPFRDKLTALMAERNHSLNDVAGRVGVSTTTVHRWLDDRKPGEPTLGVALRLARLYGVTIDYLGDPAQAEPHAGPTAREEVILELVRALGESVAIRRLAELVREDEARRVNPGQVPAPAPLTRSIEVAGRPVPSSLPALASAPRKAAGK